jgi:glycosyltransferase involved in cell wall biosynthesis
MNYLASHGYHVMLVTYEQGDNPNAFALDGSILQRDLSTRFYLLYKHSLLRRIIERRYLKHFFLKRLQFLVDDFQPQIIVTTTYQINLLDKILQLRTNAFLVLESHVACHKIQKSYNYPGGLKRFIARQYDSYYFKKVGCFDKIVTLTSSDAQEWKHFTNNVTIIPNPVTLYPNHIELKSTNYNRIICAGRLHEQKGFDLLIEAFSLIANKCPNWVVDIFGEGDDEAFLKQLIAAKKMEGRIVIHSPTSLIYDEYQKSDFYVLSSRYEGYGLVLLEAMACGIPCVSFRCKYGPEEIITSGEDGLLVDDGNVQALADSMLWMIDHSAERKEMGEKARVHVAKYKKDIIMRSWITLFDELCNSNYGKLVR